MANFKMNLLHPVSLKNFDSCNGLEIKELCNWGLASELGNPGDQKSFQLTDGTNCNIKVVDLEQGRYKYSRQEKPTHAVFEFNIEDSNKYFSLQSSFIEEPYISGAEYIYGHEEDISTSSQLLIANPLDSETNYLKIISENSDLVGNYNKKILFQGGHGISVVYSSLSTDYANYDNGPSTAKSQKRIGFKLGSTNPNLQNLYVTFYRRQLTSNTYTYRGYITKNQPYQTSGYILIFEFTNDNQDYCFFNNGTNVSLNIGTINDGMGIENTNFGATEVYSNIIYFGHPFITAPGHTANNNIYFQSNQLTLFYKLDNPEEQYPIKIYPRSTNQYATISSNYCYFALQASDSDNTYYIFNYNGNYIGNYNFTIKTFYGGSTMSGKGSNDGEIITKSNIPNDIYQKDSLTQGEVYYTGSPHNIGINGQDPVINRLNTLLKPEDNFLSYIEDIDIATIGISYHKSLDYISQKIFLPSAQEINNDYYIYNKNLITNLNETKSSYNSLIYPQFKYISDTSGLLRTPHFYRPNRGYYYPIQNPLSSSSSSDHLRKFYFAL